MEKAMQRALFATFGLVFTVASVLGGCGGGGHAAGPSQQLSFTSAAFSVSEDGTPVAAVTVRRTGGSTGAVGATITLSDGIATGGPPPLASPVDYDNTPMVVTFADGDTTDKVITVPILDDTLVEGDETINLALGSPTGNVTIGSQGTAV